LKKLSFFLLITYNYIINNYLSREQINMNIEPGNLYHIFTRGNNRETVFYNHIHYLWFTGKLKKMIGQTYVKCLCYCLMPNHFHLLLWFPQNCDIRVFKNKYGTMLSSYTQKLNYQLGRSNSIFKKRSEEKLITDSDYALTCFYYLHQNPLRAKIVNALEDWHFSSYRDYAGLRKETICDQNFAQKMLDLPSTQEDFILDSYQSIPSWFKL